MDIVGYLASDPWNVVPLYGIYEVATMHYAMRARKPRTISLFTAFINRKWPFDRFDMEDATLL